MLVGLELGGEREVAELPAHGAEELLHGGAGAGARIAHVHALALQLVELGDVRFLAGQHREGLGVHREHRAQIAEGAAFLEGALALERIVLHVRLGETEVELAPLDGVDVVDRGAGGLDRAAQAVGLAVLVDEAADGAADRVVDAGHPAGPDGDEFLLRLGGAAGEQRRADRESGREHL
jgi:hypothetical protein